MNWFHKTLLALIAAIVFFVGILVTQIFFLVPGNFGSVEIRVERGQPFAAVVRNLAESKVIRNEKLFLLWARLTGGEKKIQWGVYRFDTPLPPRDVLDRLVNGKRVFLAITIPEGLTVRETAELLARMDIVDRDEFLKVASDPNLLGSLGLEDKGLEGYLFPDTYRFMPMTSEKDIIATMLEQFRKASEPLLSQRDDATGLTSHEIITLASIIEKETGIPAERPLVSAVFHNRLKRNMPLQSDPTTIYGLKSFDGNLTRKHLRDPHPYNTYRIPALPPGPICNPGLASIKAALQPADVPYLFFVSKNDGSHVFSEDLDAHNQAVRTHQAVRQARRSAKGAAPLQ